MHALAYCRCRDCLADAAMTHDDLIRAYEAAIRTVLGLARAGVEL